MLRDVQMDGEGQLDSGVKGVMKVWLYRIRTRAERRRRLRLRLMRIFSMDALEGQLDCLVRSVKR